MECSMRYKKILKREAGGGMINVFYIPAYTVKEYIKDTLRNK